MPKIKNVRLSKVVADRLQERIIQQRLTVDDKLPTEPELMEEFGVSRTVIREAAALLVSKGIVDVRPHRGMTVRAIDGQGIAESLNAHLRMSHVSMSQLLQVRHVLETGIVRLAAVERTVEDIARLRDNLTLMKSSKHDPEKTIQVDTAFHELLASTTHNPFFVLVCRPIIELLRNLYQDRGGYMSLVGLAYAEHKAITDAIEDGAVEVAEKAMREHLDRTERNVKTLIPEIS